MIRGIARILWEVAQFEVNPEEHPILRPLALHVIGLYGRGPGDHPRGVGGGPPGRDRAPDHREVGPVRGPKRGP